MTTPPRPLRLYLVRHGQTEWSLSGQHTGRTDVSLTAQGAAEARAITPYFGRLSFDHVLTSPMRRARRTCDLVGLGARAVIDHDLAEWDYGDYEGLRTTDIRRTQPGWNVFDDGCPNGEQPADVSARADRVIERLAKMSGDVALFSHGHFGPALAVRWIGLSIATGRRFPLGTASLSILGFNPSHPEDRVIGLWNATPDLFGA